MSDLQGVLVVSVEQVIAAPLATLRLADVGTRVIKVERPEGDFARGYDRLVHKAVMHLLGRAGIACERLSTREDLSTHLQARHITVDTPTGQVEMVGRRARVTDQPQSFGRVPALGKRSHRLKQEFGANAGGRGV